MTIVHTLDPAGFRGRRRPRFARGRADESRDSYNRRRLRAQLTVLLLAMSDVVLIKSTWDVVLEQPSLVSWLVATVTAVTGATLMWTAGLLAAHGSAYGGRLVARFVLVAGWALLGAGVCYVRWNSASFTGTQLLGEGTSSAPAPDTTQHILALALTALYVAPGLLAYRDAADLGNPVGLHQRRTHADLAQVRQQLASLEGAVLDTHGQLTRAQAEIAQGEHAVVQAKAAHADLARELCAHVRRWIAQSLGDPAAGGITEPGVDPTGAPTTHHD